jgi:hypothetical protein
MTTEEQKPGRRSGAADVGTTPEGVNLVPRWKRIVIGLMVALVLAGMGCLVVGLTMRSMGRPLAGEGLLTMSLRPGSRELRSLRLPAGKDLAIEMQLECRSGCKAPQYGYSIRLVRQDGVVILDEGFHGRTAHFDARRTRVKTFRLEAQGTYRLEAQLEVHSADAIRGELEVIQVPQPIPHTTVSTLLWSGAGGLALSGVLLLLVLAAARRRSPSRSPAAAE